MKTKFLAVLMALVAMTTLASGCGGSKKQEGTPVDVTVGRQTKEPVATEEPVPAVDGVELDETYTGDGYQISYPSDYIVEDDNGFTVEDPESNFRINVTIQKGAGSIDGITADDMESLIADNSDLEDTEIEMLDFKETDVDGNKCYIVKYSVTVEQITIPMYQYFISDGTDLYCITRAEMPYMSDGAEQMAEAIIDTFEII